MQSERDRDETELLRADSGPDEGYDPWPRDWSGGSDVGDERVLREHREGLIRGRIRGGSRWEVPVPAAIAAAFLAFAVVAVAVVLLLRSSNGGDGVSIGESEPLVSISATPGQPSSAADTGDGSAAGVGAGGGTGAAAGTGTGAAAGADTGDESGNGVLPGGRTGSEAGAGGVSGPGLVPSAGSGGVPQPGVSGVASRVYVVGQVRSPGVVALGSDARVQDAIAAAGGATGRADLARINLARRVIDGERILVPKPGQKIPDEPTVGDSAGAGAGAGAGGGGGAGSGASGGAPGSPIDLNTASVTELDALPGVGPVLAGRIVEWRQTNGKFTTVDDLNEVSGIGDATMEKLRPMVRV